MCNIKKININQTANDIKNIYKIQKPKEGYLKKLNLAIQNRRTSNYLNVAQDKPREKQNPTNLSTAAQNFIQQNRSAIIPSFKIKTNKSKTGTSMIKPVSIALSKIANNRNDNINLSEFIQQHRKKASYCSGQQSPVANNKTQLKESPTAIKKLKNINPRYVLSSKKQNIVDFLDAEILNYGKIDEAQKNKTSNNLPDGQWLAFTNKNLHIYGKPLAVNLDRSLLEDQSPMKNINQGNTTFHDLFDTLLIDENAIQNNQLPDIKQQYIEIKGNHQNNIALKNKIREQRESIKSFNYGNSDKSGGKAGSRIYTSSESQSNSVSSSSNKDSESEKGNEKFGQKFGYNNRLKKVESSQSFQSQLFNQVHDRGFLFNID